MENILRQNSPTLLRASCNAIQFLLDENFHKKVPRHRPKHQSILPALFLFGTALTISMCWMPSCPVYFLQECKLVVHRNFPGGNWINLSQTFIFFFLPARGLSVLFPSSTTDLLQEADPRNAKSSEWPLAHKNACGTTLDLQWENSVSLTFFYDRIFL